MNVFDSYYDSNTDGHKVQKYVSGIEGIWEVQIKYEFYLDHLNRYLVLNCTISRLKAEKNIKLREGDFDDLMGMLLHFSQQVYEMSLG